MIISALVTSSRILSLLILLAATTLNAQEIVEPRNASIASSQLLDKIAAVVNNDIILQSALERKVRDVANQMRKQDRQPPMGAIRQQVLDQLITETVLLEDARERGVRVDDIELNQAIERIARQNQLSVGELREQVIQDGNTYRQFREDIRQQITIQKLTRRMINARVEVTEQEITNYLNSQLNQANTDIEFELSRILVELPEGANPDTIDALEERAVAIYQRLKRGEDFSQVAVEVSRGSNAIDGGSLGWRLANQLPSSFTRALVNLNPGDITTPIRTSNGFHILKLQDVRGQQRNLTNQVRSRHILLTTNTIRDDQAARRELENIRQRLAEGEDFARLAREFSQDPGSAPNGGELGWAEPKIYTPAFRKRLENLQPNTVSEPFKSNFGWHIVEVLERRRFDNTFEEQRQQARNNIFQRKAQEEEALWRRNLRDRAFVDIRI